MKYITIFSKHFWPENFKINDIALNLNKKFIINVFTSRPNYNDLKHKSYSNYKNYNGIKITYFKSYKKSKDSFLEIFLDYISYILNLLFKINFYFKNKTDLCFIFATSPIFQAIPAIYYAKIKKIPSVIWVQDLWPEVLEDTGYLKNKFLLSIVDKMVRIIYKNSDIILAQSKSFEKHLKKKYNLKNKVFTLHQPAEYNFQKYNPTKKNIFKITYAGNFGKAQDFQTILNAFKSNKIDKKVILNLIGSGKKYNLLKKEIQNSKIKSKVRIFPYQDKKKITKILRSSSAFFLSLNKGKSLDKTIPGKFQTYLAFGKPILACSNGSINDLIVKNKLGLVSKPNDLKKLIYNINKLSQISKSNQKKIYFSSKRMYEDLFEINKIIVTLIKYFYIAKKKYVKKNIL